MKKFICGMFAAFFVLIAATAIFDKEEQKRVVVENVVITENASQDSALDARFLNMLNHNYIYNEDFNCVDDIVNGSVPALLKLRDKDNGEYIAEYHVEDYVYNMYGIEIFDMSELNSQFPQKSGYLYIIPRGFDEYKHEVESVVPNEDGTYSVTTKVTIFDQYGEVTEKRAKTLFVKNEQSDFGYNIVYSDIL